MTTPWIGPGFDASTSRSACVAPRSSGDSRSTPSSASSSVAAIFTSAGRSFGFTVFDSQSSG